MPAWFGACIKGCVCDQCWDHGDECGHVTGTCTRTPIESFNEALAKGQVAIMDEED